MIDLFNPIPEAVRDPKKLTDLLTKYQIVPYFGTMETTSHSMLQLISDLSQLSPSSIACKRDIRTFSFSSRVDIRKRGVPGVIEPDSENPLSQEEKVDFFNFLGENGLSVMKILESNEQLFNFMFESGNAYMIVRIVKLNGIVRIFLFPTHYRQVAYLATNTTENPHVIVTEYWDEEWWKIKKPQIYPVSYIGEPFNWNIRQNGQVYETMIHIRENTAGGLYYGRKAEFLATLNAMFAEYCQLDLFAKIANTEFTAKTILAFEETDPARKQGMTDNQDSAFQDSMRTLRQLTTREGTMSTAKSLVGLEYPYGQKPPIQLPLAINRDTEFSRHMLDAASSYIYAINGWSKQLTGLIEVRSNIGGNVVLDLFVTKNVSTILPIQYYWENNWGSIFYEIGQVIQPGRVMHTLMFPDQVYELTVGLRGSEVIRNLAVPQIEENSIKDGPATDTSEI